ncbi:WbqC family protein [Bradyrhizobium sp. TZ2]
MILSTVQPSFLPWLGYFEQMARADIFVYLDDVQYTKQDWRNRNRFKAANGKIEFLTVPIRADDATTSINQVRIAEGTWARKIVNRLEEWYRKAPAFNEFFPQIRDELLKEGELLADLDVRLTELLAQFMRLETPIAFSSAIPGKSADKNQKLIDICRHFGADVLYDGAAAASFIELDCFRANGIEVVFQAYKPISYPQQGGGNFLSHLSAVDTTFQLRGEDEAGHARWRRQQPVERRGARQAGTPGLSDLRCDRLEAVPNRRFGPLPFRGSYDPRPQPAENHMRIVRYRFERGVWREFHPRGVRGQLQPQHDGRRGTHLLHEERPGGALAGVPGLDRASSRYVACHYSGGRLRSGETCSNA